MKRWLKVRKQLGSFPITEGLIGGESPLYVERYLFRSIEKTVSAVGSTVLLTQFGGARVHEGEAGHWRASALPSQGMLLPPTCATHWHYSGTVDFAAFYFPERQTGILKRLSAVVEANAAPMTLNDHLVGAAAHQLVNELARGSAADEDFMSRLAQIMLEQVYRAFTNSSIGHFDPRHIHYSRLQAVLSYIHENMGQDLSAQMLAERAEVSLAHFRRLFEEAMGVPVHRYVLNIRLEQARKLLTFSATPISRIAQDCGFCSQSHLTASFKKVHAATPAQFRARNADAEPGLRES